MSHDRIEEGDLVRMVFPDGTERQFIAAGAEKLDTGERRVSLLGDPDNPALGETESVT